MSSWKALADKIILILKVVVYSVACWGSWCAEVLTPCIAAAARWLLGKAVFGIPHAVPFTVCAFALLVAGSAMLDMRIQLLGWLCICISVAMNLLVLAALNFDTLRSGS